MVLSSAENSAFVTRAFQDLLHRSPEPPTLAYFSSLLNHSYLNRYQVSLSIVQSPEYRAAQVQGLYTALLHRGADPGGQSYFVGLLNAGTTAEQVEAALAGSQEYFQTRSSASNNGFLSAFFQDALNRPVDPSGQSGFGQQLAAGTPRGQVAMEILNSPEYKQVQVLGGYQQLLRRPADPGGLASWVGGLLQGMRDEAFVAGMLSSDEFAPGASAAPILLTDDVDALLHRAAAASPRNDAIIAIVDRGGNVLGVRVEAGVSSAITGNPAMLTFAIDGALAEARSAAFFANNQLPLTSRTVQFISQSTITQREVDSNPSIADPNSPARGPGFVAPVGLGGHFPPGVANTPPVDLFGIEHTNRDSILHPGPDHLKTDGITLRSRFDADPAFIPFGVNLPAPESYGYVSGLQHFAQSRGIGTLPGGIPIYKANDLVGGIGVFFPGTTGFASAENSSLSATFNPALPDLSLVAEYMAFAAVGGDPALALPVGTLDGVAPVPNITFPLGPGQGVNLAGIALTILGPGAPGQGPSTLFTFGQSLGTSHRFADVNEPVDTSGHTLLEGQPMASGWLVLPHNGVGISTADVTRMINQGIAEASQVRAQIRLPLGSTTKMVFAVADSTGELLGLYRMPDATIFSIDVAVAKARNVAYYDNAAQLQPQDLIPGLPPGVAFTNRTFRYTAQPRFPEGIDNTPPGPQSILNDPGINPHNGLDSTFPLPASDYQSAYGFDSFNPGSNFHSPFNVRKQNGVVFFPGSSAVYKAVNGFSTIVGGLGASGDGVNQDDIITSFAGAGFAPPDALRADQFFLRGVRLPYVTFPRNPTTP
jgi:uncharacterized protein GlcG (DUF336 family)